MKIDGAIEVRGIVFPNGVRLAYNEQTGKIEWAHADPLKARVIDVPSALPLKIELPDGVAGYGAAERALLNELKAKFNELLVIMEELRIVALDAHPLP